MYYIAETSSESDGVTQTHWGVMFNVFCLYSDVKLAELLIQIRLMIVQMAARESVKINLSHLESPKMNLDYISAKLDSVKKANKKWTFQNIFKRLKATCFSPSRESCPNFSQGVEKIAAHFKVVKHT